MGITAATVAQSAVSRTAKMGVSFVTCQKPNERSRFHGCACVQNPLLFFNLVPLERVLDSFFQMKVFLLSFPHRHQVVAMALIAYAQV